MAFPVAAPKQNFVLAFLQQTFGPLKLWQWLAIVVFILYLDRQGIVDVPLIGGQKKVVRNIRRK